MIASPLVSQVVTSSPTKVVTSAIPPVSARAYLNDSLNTSGPRTIFATVNTATAIRNPDAFSVTPWSSHAATISPTALATSSTTVLARNRAIARLPAAPRPYAAAPARASRLAPQASPSVRSHA